MDKNESNNLETFEKNFSLIATELIRQFNVLNDTRDKLDTKYDRLG